MNETPEERSARRLLAAVIFALMAGGVAYRLLVLKRLEHSSLVFIGIPAVIAMATLYVRPRSAIGTVNKIIAIALCMSGVVFGEALVCIAMAAPIFILAGTVVGALINWFQKPDAGDPPGSAQWRAGIGIALLPLSIEGVVPSFEFNRDERVTVTRTVNATPGAIRSALEASPRFDRELPAFFRLGFPVPAHATGSGIAVGDERSVMFLHGEHHNGALLMVVSAADSSSVTFSAVRDSSYITHWLSWRDARVEWKPVGPDSTAVTWTLRYRRRLDPAWYFAPLERYGAWLAARYLLETLTTPRDATPGPNAPLAAPHGSSHVTDQR
jgi:hypothetical protein